MWSRKSPYHQYSNFPYSYWKLLYLWLLLDHIIMNNTVMIYNKYKYRLDNRNLKFFKRNSIIAQFIKPWEGIEWVYLFNLDKRFQRYLHFSVRKKGVFVGKRKGNFILWVAAPETELLMFFFVFFFCTLSPLGINPHNFVKNYHIFKNKGFILCKILLGFTGNIFHVAKKVAFALGSGD